MAASDGFDAMSDLCIEAGEAVMRHGSADLQAAMRVLLAMLGQEIALRMASPLPMTGFSTTNAPRPGRRHLRGRPVH